MAQRPYHHGDLERALVDAAFDVVRTEGIAAVSIRDLARSVGVSPSAAYRHFPSRDHLISRVSQLARQALAAELVGAMTSIGGTGRRRRRSIDRFQAIGRAYVTFAIQHPRVFEAAFVRCSVRPTTADDPDAWGILVAAIDEMIETGAIDPARREDGPVIAWAGVHGLSQIVTGSTWPDGVAPDHYVDAVVAGITRSLG